MRLTVIRHVPPQAPVVGEESSRCAAVRLFVRHFSFVFRMSSSSFQGTQHNASFCTQKHARGGKHGVLGSKAKGKFENAHDNRHQRHKKLGVTGVTGSLFSLAMLVSACSFVFPVYSSRRGFHEFRAAYLILRSNSMYNSYATLVCEIVTKGDRFDFTRGTRTLGSESSDRVSERSVFV